MSSARTVVDASVVVELLLDRGSRGESISTRLWASELHAPDHVMVEVISTMRRLTITGKLGEPEAALARRALWNMSIQLWRFEQLSQRAWELNHNLSSYDAAYVALAELLDAPLLTADARLARASGPTCAIEVVE